MFLLYLLFIFYTLEMIALYIYVYIYIYICVCKNTSMLFWVEKAMGKWGRNERKRQRD